MTKAFKRFVLFFVVFFFIGLFFQYALYNRTKSEFISNNAILINNLLENHPELEKEIIGIIKNMDYTNENLMVLEKYGLTNLSSLDYLKSFQSFQKVFFGVYIVFFLLIATFFISYFYFVQRRRKKEIEKVDKYLFSLLSEEINVDLKDFQSGELASLQNDLMKVTSRLKNSLESSTHDKQELSKTLADVSHQLKTPLTSLSIINDALRNFTIDEEKQKEFLKKQEELLEHMKMLIITLLKVSQIESGMIELKKERVSFKELLNHVYEQLDVIMVSRGIVLHQEVEDVSVMGDFYWIGEAILNVLKNACEHSPENGTVNVLVSQNPMYTEIIIEDFGEGIPKSEIPHIFERFYKSSKAKDSIGIGLNLTKSIMDRSNATISVSSKKGSTKFIIHFYKGVV